MSAEPGCPEPKAISQVGRMPGQLLARAEAPQAVGKVQNRTHDVVEKTAPKISAGTGLWSVHDISARRAAVARVDSMVLSVGCMDR